MLMNDCFIFAKKAKIVAVQFLSENQKKYKNTQLVELLPWISAFKKIDKKVALEKLNLKDGFFTILVFGGSQGALFINETFYKVAENIKDKNIQVIHICGDEAHFKKAKSIYEKLNIAAYISSYEKDMSLIYAASDLVICRAGAATISELMFFEIPSFLIPYPMAAKNHQEKNALFMKNEVKGAEVFLQNNFNFESFLEAVYHFIDREEKYITIKKNLSEFKKNIKKENRKSLSQLILDLDY
jgi:UDP-N-acetylglucosamine--N-acetylmuramyl-(pentapeptide) pyrophosphoryl-undecaprenol N-acetylglucosamine transferase